jgi:hypothetical protein
MFRYNPKRNLLALLFCLAAIFGCASDIRNVFPEPSWHAPSALAESVPDTGILVAGDGTVTFNNDASDVQDISISRTIAGAGTGWQPIDPDKFRGIHTTAETLYVRFRSATGVISEIIVYYGILPEGAIVKTPDNPDVYIIKYKGGKQYRRLILSPSVFSSYGHLKWSNLKIVPPAQLDRYLLSNLVQVAGDPTVYVLTPLGDTGERHVLDTSRDYDADSVYEINTTDRDSYVLVSGGAPPPASGTDTDLPVVTSFFLPATSAELEVPIYSFTATDNVGVLGYAVTESSTPPSRGAFSSPAPASYAFDSEGAKVLYGWARDGAGNISAPLTDSVVIGEIQRTCAGARTQVCAVEHGVGSQERICSEGAWSAWGNCQVLSCESGYELSGGSCVQQEGTDDTDDTDDEAGDNTDAADTTAPTLSSIAAVATDTGAAITWTTDEAATSSLSYGTTSAYGEGAVLPEYVTSHALTLTGLKAGTTYHYRVSSKDAAGNTASSSDKTFVTTAAASPYITGALTKSAKVRFLHHSTGDRIMQGGVMNVLSQYNSSHGTSYALTEKPYFPKSSPYGWNNNPYDYWNMWVKHANDAAYYAKYTEPTLEMLTKDYDLIIWKHCYPTSDINPDTGSARLDTDVRTIENYKLQYAALKEKMHQFPKTRFLVWTPAALVASATTAEKGERTNVFTKWVIEQWDEPGDNIFVWDFRTLETGGGPFLLPANAVGPSDSHPNPTFGAKTAPVFVQRIADVIEGRGDSTK